MGILRVEMLRERGKTGENSTRSQIPKENVLNKNILNSSWCYKMKQPRKYE